jgi:uncharacterized protein (TIGR02453 family)
MMRIYRDIRFSNDKSPYKTCVAAHFWHARPKDGATPAYYLHFEPPESIIGGGIWQPEAKVLKMIRDGIVANPDGWRKATSGQTVGSTCSMAGESLKRAPVGYDANHPLIEDIKRKDFAVSAQITDREIISDNFLDLVLDRFRATEPFLRFLSNAIGLS